MTIAIRLLRDRRRSIVGWSIGLVALVLFTVSLFPSLSADKTFDELVKDMPEAVKSMIGYQDQVPLTSAPGYLQARLFSTIAPVLALVFGIGVGAAAIGGYEEAGRMEPLLATPVTRTRVAVERYLAALALLLGFVAVFTAAVVLLGLPFGALEEVERGGLAGACLAMFGIAALHLTIAYAVGALTGRRGSAVAVAAAVAAAGYLVYSVLAMVDVPRSVRLVTPWQWYLDRNMLASGPSVLAVVTPLVVTAILAVLGVVAFGRRDLR